MEYLYLLLPLFAGWILDRMIGDPIWLPHPVVGYGKAISFFEHRLNHGSHRVAKGGMMAIGLVITVFFATFLLLRLIPSPPLRAIAETIIVFYCLAGTTLAREVGDVFKAVGKSVEDGRRQVARIVGRDTGALDSQEIQTAALETLAENLSDGVVAPLFWYALLGAPGMMAYKMTNTLDSMVGYRNDRYLLFGRVSARMDDAANYLAARLTALLILLAAGQPRLWSFVVKNGPKHLSPNSGWPEAAMAGVLHCRFGGPHNYFGEEVYKPYIGDNDRLLTGRDADIAIKISRRAEAMAVCLTAIVRLAITIPAWI